MKSLAIIGFTLITPNIAGWFWLRMYQMAQPISRKYADITLNIILTLWDTHIKKYPRYICDQLSIIKKQQEKYGKPELSAALTYCIERELFSANDFRDTLEYFQLKQPGSPVREIKLDIKYRVVTAQIRDLSVYSDICKGGNCA